jgi:hypothetical protein
LLLRKNEIKNHFFELPKLGIIYPFQSFFQPKNIFHC